MSTHTYVIQHPQAAAQELERLRARVSELEADKAQLMTEVATRTELAELLAQRDGRVAELEAAQEPVKFSERKPEDGQRVLALNCEYGGYWELYDYYDDNYGVPNCLTHWLPMPPAPAVE